MNKRYYAIIIFGIALAGCATTSNEGPTLASLGAEIDFEIRTDEVIAGARGKAMDNYWEFMNTSPKDNLKIEAMRRLADLELERSEERFQKQLEVLDKRETDAITDQDELREITYRGAIKLYKDALGASKGTDKKDAQVFYQLSKAYEQAGKPKKALESLNKLLANFPNVANRDEIHFRRGELFFSLREYKKAGAAYNQAMIVSPGSVYFEKALSQRGWMSFKQGKYQSALGSFFNLVDRKTKGQASDKIMQMDKLARGDRELVEDTFRVITLTFNELLGSKSVYDFFTKYGQRNYESKVYRDLGDYYLKKGRIEDAAITYGRFVEEYPDHKKAYEFGLSEIAVFEQGGFAVRLIDAKKRFVLRYRVDGGYWVLQSQTVQAELIPHLEKNVADIAKHYHSIAQKEKSSGAFQQAYMWYQQYLKSFPNSEKAQKINFLYAEILFENEHYETAAKEYENTAYRYIRQGKDAEAGYAALLAYGKLEERALDDKKKRWSSTAIGAALRFGKAFPNDKRAPAVVTKAAEDLFALKKYDQAATAAKTIIELSAETKIEMRQIAWRIIAQAEFEKADYARAEVSYKLALSLTKDKKSRKILEKGIAASIYKHGEYLRKSGKIRAAVAQLMRVRDVAPGSDVAIAAEFDIAASLIDRKDWGGAIRELNGFRKAHPNHPLTEKAGNNLIFAYMEYGRPLDAAMELEKVRDSKKKLDARRDAAWRIAELYSKHGKPAQTIAAYKKIIKIFPTPVDTVFEARHKIAELYAKNGDNKKHHFWLKNIIDAQKKNAKKSTDRMRYLAAKATYELAEPLISSYRRILLVAPLKKNLKKKKKYMKAAVTAFTAAADYGVAEVTTASVYWLGEIYNDFGRELIKSERPPGLSADELEQYDILLEEQAYPFEEKSINIHESNVKRVYQGMYDEWVQKSFAALKKLSPVRYAKVERSEIVASHVQ